jgi:hypothetical protein
LRWLLHDAHVAPVVAPREQRLEQVEEEVAH